MVFKEICNDSGIVLVSRALLATNMLHGCTVIESFQMAREYSSSTIELRASIVPEELFITQIHLTAHRSLQKAIA